MNGYAGKILRVNLTYRKITTIPTSRYEHGLGATAWGRPFFSIW